ncbi:MULTISPECIES: hypothetical protein [Catenuloplanes]|uniref:Uncharacterized protein n=1 Tax=Catenuloplanes niger TaxID=587534 RepID=A0AAE4CVG0_9ACTN|nr:hypothetical protein [Catenuloplanes niger]MDR7327326.1 hypothetical protein [Catenuloplanes niger]
MTVTARPVFSEGQILAATDLSAIVDAARHRAARHDRYLHDWGIAEGLDLAGASLTDPETGLASVEVTLRAGVAIDGTGREVVVPADVALQESAFQDVNGADPGTDGPFPVFLAGLDRHTGGRVDESYQILFGRPGDERLVGEQRPPGVGDGPGDGSRPWLILLGFVRWRGGRFTEVEPDAPGARRRHAGVRAGTVSAREGTLALRARPSASEGGPVVTIDETRGLVFGRYRADGTVDPLLTVSPRGDLSAAGSITGGQSLGVAVASGVATDGMLLPLPAGFRADEVADGDVLLHTTVTPHVTPAPADLPGVWLAVPLECAVGADRRLRCRTRWVRVDTPGETADRPSAADFMVVATAAGTP